MGQFDGLPTHFAEARGHAAEFGPGFGAGAALEEATSLAKAPMSNVVLLWRRFVICGL